MLARLVVLAIAFGAACSLRSATFVGVDDPGDGGVDAPPLPACDVGHTGRLTGTVFAPSGTLPLAGVTVYVAASDPGPLPNGPSCGCATPAAVVSTRTAPDGSFRLDGVPAGVAGRLVVQTGKWRRQLALPAVEECGAVAVDPALTRLPRNRGEGDLPRIAVATANDTLECLPAWIGVDPAEITVDSGAGSVHLYASPNAANATTAIASGETMAPVGALTSSAARLAAYDLVLLGCDTQNTAMHAPADEQNLVDYTAAGGRLFLGHFQASWIVGAPAPWPALGSFSLVGTGALPATGVLTIDTSSSTGATLASWFAAVDHAPAGRISIDTPRSTCRGLASSAAQPLIRLERALNPMFVADGVQMFEFSTPLGAATRCGRVMFSDIHATGPASTRMPYPGECTLTASANTLAAAYALFELGSCP